MRPYLAPYVRAALFATLGILPPWACAAADGNVGYYRFPALHGGSLLFTAEGDLWSVPAKGGLARRLTTHAGAETHAELSPDGKTVAFAASYEGPREIYTMPVGGGLPERVTYEGYEGRRGPHPVAWRSGHELVYATRYFARRDAPQLVVANVETGARERIPLEQASDGVFDGGGETLFFTRLPRQNSFAKRYRGGLIENLWRFDTAGGKTADAGEGGAAASEEAVPLTGDYRGTSRSPMLWKDRLYFVCDRDGTMNIWSMRSSGDGGRDLRQHTEFEGFDVLSPDLDRGRIAFQRGADLWIYDIAKDRAKRVPIRLGSDFDQKRKRWLDDPLSNLEAYAVDEHGEKVAVTVRGRAFVARRSGGRLVKLPQEEGTRYRSPAFLPGEDRVVLLSDESGETEFWSFPDNGHSDEERQLTEGATTLRYRGTPSPDGAMIAHTDRDQFLWLVDVESGEGRKVWQSEEGSDFDWLRVAWSADSRWLAFSDTGANMVRRIYLFDASSDDPEKQPIAITTDRLDSYSPTFSPDGRWLYFLSDRTFRSVQGSPWGPRQPEPYLDSTTGIYALDLVGGARSPFDPGDELAEASTREEEDGEGEVKVRFRGITERVFEVPLRPGNYRHLRAADEHLYFMSETLELNPQQDLTAFPITTRRAKQKPVTIIADCRSYVLSGDRSTVVERRWDRLYAFEANGKPPEDIDLAEIDLSGVGVDVSPAEDWRGMFVDAWRLHRDYFYDPEMHGVDWVEVRERHEPLLARVSDRWELDDLIGMMVGELSAMHTDIRPGDVRSGDEGSSIAHLGARVRFDQRAGGHVIEHIFEGDPDYPDKLSPLGKPGMDIEAGDVITAVDGVPSATVGDLSELLVGKAGRQVLLEVKRRGFFGGKRRQFIVQPISGRDFRDLKLGEWEHTRRLAVEELGGGDIGYFHMRAMGAGNFAEFVRGFYPVVDRKGLIIDMRQNYGGNIDSWILSRLMRKAWMWWQARTGRPYPNMHFAFGGHMVVLVDAYTISDGEAFSEGFRRLGLGEVIGTRTWGGGIWLRSNNTLVDGGIARSPEFGVYAPEGVWLIEGDGLEPDIVVDNPPHATFNGEDAQLEAAVEYLKKKIVEDPPEVPQPPKRPAKANAGD